MNEPDEHDPHRLLICDDDPQIGRFIARVAQDLGYQVDLLAPDQPLSGVDLTIAGVQKMKVLDPVTTVPPTGPIPQAVGNRVYVLDAEGLSAQKTIERLQSLLASLEKAGLRPQSMEALA